MTIPAQAFRERLDIPDRTMPPVVLSRVSNCVEYKVLPPAREMALCASMVEESSISPSINRFPVSVVTSTATITPLSACAATAWKAEGPSLNKI